MAAQWNQAMKGFLLSFAQDHPDMTELQWQSLHVQDSWILILCKSTHLTQSNTFCLWGSAEEAAGA